jgi:HEPN domain-containing protein
MRDAELLFRKGRYDASAYLCGYVVEFALKARICKHSGGQTTLPLRRNSKACMTSKRMILILSSNSLDSLITY